MGSRIVTAIAIIVVLVAGVFYIKGVIDHPHESGNGLELPRN